MCGCGEVNRWTVNVRDTWDSEQVVEIDRCPYISPKSPLRITGAEQLHDCMLLRAVADYLQEVPSAGDAVLQVSLASIKTTRSR